MHTLKMVELSHLRATRDGPWRRSGASDSLQNGACLIGQVHVVWPWDYGGMRFALTVLATATRRAYAAHFRDDVAR
jgi:hypothetical protein